MTGSPGVGKTTVAKELTSRLNARYISLSDVVRELSLVSGVDETRDVVIANVNALSGYVEGIVSRSEGDVVIEGHYAPDVIPEGGVPYVFVLRRDPEYLWAALVARGYNERKVIENVTSEILDVCMVDAVRKYGLGGVYEIDVTKMTFEETADEILKVLEGRTRCKAGNVDWLHTLEREGRLAQMLSKIGKE